MQITSSKGDKIDGEGVFKKHENWLLLESFSFGKEPSEAMESSPAVTEADPTAKKQTLEEKAKERREKYYGTDVIVQRMFDVASPYLMAWLFDKNARKVEFDLCTEKGESVFNLKLELARLTKYSASSQKPEGTPETLTISWEKFEITTSEMGADGKART